MHQNRRIQLLAAASIITLSALISIQVYLISNTYQLHKSGFNRSLKQKIDTLAQLPAMGDLEDLMQENLKNAVTSYLKGKLTREGILKELKSLNASQGETYWNRLRQLAEQRFGTVGLYYQSEYNELTLEAPGRADTLLKTTDAPFTVIGPPKVSSERQLLNRNTWVINRTISDEKVPGREIDLRIVVKQSNYFWVSDWQLSIYREMAAVLILAIFLIAAIITLFYLIFHSLISQKKLTAMKTDFANNVTHELKTPLSSVSVILKSMKKIDINAQPMLMEELIGSMDRQYLKIQRLVDHVLESTSSDPVLQTESIDIRDFLLEYARDLAVPGHELELEIDPSPVRLQSSPLALMRIMNILVDNAAKYSPQGSPILISSFVRDAHYHLQVSDQGAGIERKHQKLIFEKFYRVPEHNHHNVKGLGLGLFIARATASQINASLELAANDQNGCTFMLTLPL